MNWAQWLIGMVGPVTARVLASLGLTMVSITGGNAMLSALRERFIDALMSAAPAGVQLAGLFGAWECAGIWFGAASFVLSWNLAGGVTRFSRAGVPA